MLSCSAEKFSSLVSKNRDIETGDSSHIKSLSKEILKALNRHIIHAYISSVSYVSALSFHPFTLVFIKPTFFWIERKIHHSGFVLIFHLLLANTLCSVYNCFCQVLLDENKKFI